MSKIILDRKGLDRLNRLKRRRDWLHNRIVSEPEKDLSFDKSELSALEWAIEVIEEAGNAYDS